MASFQTMGGFGEFVFLAGDEDLQMASFMDVKEFVKVVSLTKKHKKVGLCIKYYMKIHKFNLEL